MITFKRTNSTDDDFQNLVRLLDKDLAQKNGDKNDFFAQFNTIDLIKNVIIAFENNQAVACGAMKQYDSETMEIKRMFVLPSHRGRAIGYSILSKLENWALELGFKKTVLETGDKMTEAISLYKKAGYEIIPNYEPYINETSSICFNKIL